MNLTPEQQTVGRRNFLKAVAGVPGAGGPRRRRGHARAGGRRPRARGLHRPRRRRPRAAGAGRSGVCRRQGAVRHQPGAVDARRRGAGQDRQAQGDALRRLQGHARQGGHRGRDHRHAAVGARRSDRDLPRSGQARALREDDGVGRRGLRAHAAGRRGAPGACSRSAISASTAPMYQAAYEGIIKAGMLGDIYTARIAWHRNGNWRRAGEPPTPDYDPSPWGYKDWEHLLNWRLYKQYSRGLLAELASHQVNIVNWFFDAVPEAVHGSGGVHRWKDGREVDDHVYATFEYPGGRTATFSSIESNAFDHYYEAFFGTKGTLMLKGETEAYLFEEGGGARPTGIEVAAAAGGPGARGLGEPRGRCGRTVEQRRRPTGGDRLASYRHEISGFCAAIRTGAPLACGPDKAIGSARRLPARLRRHRAEDAPHRGAGRADRSRHASARRNPRAAPHQAGVRLPHHPQRDPAMRAAAGRAAGHRGSRAAPRRQHHSGARGAPVAAVGRPGRKRAARRHDRHAAVARLDPRRLHHHGGPADRRRARGGPAGDAGRLRESRSR